MDGQTDRSNGDLIYPVLRPHSHKCAILDTLDRDRQRLIQAGNRSQGDRKGLPCHYFLSVYSMFIFQSLSYFTRQKVPDEYT